MSKWNWNTGRKAALLGSTSAAVLLAGMAAMTPQQARAANECGNIPGGAGAKTINCSGVFTPSLSNLNGGIEYSPALGQTPFTLNVGNGVAVTSITATNFILVPGNGVTIANLTLGVPTSGVQVDAIVNVNQTTSIGAQNDGVLVWTDGAGNDATVNVAGQINAGHFGINAVAGGPGNPAGAGSVFVTNTSTGNIVSTDSGINAYVLPGGSTGNVVVTNDGSIRSTGGSGIVVKDPLLGVAPSAGNATISNTGAVLGNVHGVYVLNSGDATVTNADYDNPNPLGLDRSGFIAGATATGVTLLAGGNATVNNSSSLGIAGGTDGVFLGAAGNATVNNTNDASIIGLSGSGVSIIAGGNGSVTNEGGLIAGGYGNPAGEDGINALTMGDFTVTNQNTLTGSNVSQGRIYGDEDGIQFANANILNNNGNGTTTISNEGSITGAAGAGIKGFAVKDVIIGNNVGATISGGTDGINVLSLAKDVKIAHGGAVTGGQNGIIATSLLGNVVIGGKDSGNGIVYGSVDATNGTGILGVAVGNGNVNIDSGTVNAGAGQAFTIPGLGIGVGGGVVGAAVGNGNVEVNLHGNVSVASGGTFGGAAIALGDGSATVSMDDGVKIDPPLIGKLAATFGAGNATVNIGNNNIVDADLAGAVGLSFGSGAVHVNVGNNSVIGSTPGTTPTVGIFTLDTSGSAGTEIKIGTASTINGDLSAILAIAAGSGSTVSIENNGGAIIGGGSEPVIGVYSDSGVVIDNNNVVVGLTEHRGLIQSATGASDDLAVLTGGGQLTLNNDGDVIGRVTALTTNGGSNAFNINDGGTWNSSGISTFLTTGSGANTLTNAAGGQVDLTDGMINLGSVGGANTLANAGDFDVVGAAMFNLGSVSGSNFVQNSGGFTSQGAVMFNLGSVSGSNEFTNTNEMQFVGLNAFNFGTVEGGNTLTNEGYIGVAGITAFNFGSVNGSNTVTNDGGFETYGLTTFNFAAGGASTFNNNDYFSTTGVTSFLGLDDFNNFGALSMVNGDSDYGLVTMPGTESGVGDWTMIDGNFVAGPNSVLGVDAQLSIKGNSSSDVMSITGDVVGTTQVYVNYDPSVVAGYNPDGISVVRVWSGNTQPGDFQLANGPIDRGLFTYDLFLDPGAGGGGMSTLAVEAPDMGGASWVLASYADSSAYNLSAFTGLAQGVWNTTSDSWIDRAGDLRVSAEGSPDPTKKSGIWGRMIGSGAERSTETTMTPFQNQSVKIDTGYDQTLWGFQAGIDHEFEGTVADGVLIAGVLGGYVTSKADFNNGDSVTFAGPQVGVYASWIKGGLYVDGLIKGDFLKADYNVAGVDADTDSTTIGARVETGYRFLTATGMFIEPNASLAYAHTKIDDINVSGTPVNFDNGNGLEGKLGARFGGSSLKDGVKYDPYVSVGLVGELLGENTVFLDSGPGLLIEDDVPGVFGEVGVGINIFSSKSGWTGFAKADLRVGDDYFGGTGKIGANWAW